MHETNIKLIMRGSQGKILSQETNKTQVKRLHKILQDTCKPSQERSLFFLPEYSELA